MQKCRQRQNDLELEVGRVQTRGWAARGKQMGTSGRMPQRKGGGAWRRRGKHGRSGVSDGSGSDGSTEFAVK